MLAIKEFLGAPKFALQLIAMALVLGLACTLAALIATLGAVTDWFCGEGE